MFISNKKLHIHYSNEDDKLIGSFFSYPGGERGLNENSDSVTSAITRGNFCTVKARINSPTSLIDLLLAMDAIKRHHYNPVVENLCIGYLPYGRQDRYHFTLQPFSLSVICNLLDGLAKNIITLDIHSDVAAAFFNKSRFINDLGHDLISKFIDKIGLCNLDFITDLALVAPDAGASKRVEKAAKSLSIPNIVQCTKERDPISGKLSGFKVFPIKNLNPKALLIVDDICDGGGTFLGVADELRKHYPNASLYLWTSHGIYSKGIKELLTRFKVIGCSDSVLNLHNEQVASDIISEGNRVQIIGWN